MNRKIRILVAGCGGMGRSHSLAYHNMTDFEITGLVSRRPDSREALNRELGGGYPLYSDFYDALEKTAPDAVSVNTLTDTHVPFAAAALKQGCHVFLEKPMAPTAEEAEQLVHLARENNRILVIGYILQHHPAWREFVLQARSLGAPLVMRMNLNQQSSGAVWEKHRKKLETLSPLVECGVHYVDMMCRMTGAAPVRISAAGVRLTEEIPENIRNYGHMIIEFSDGSVGWYESGWGPMMSRNAFFIKDVTGPRGSVSLTASPDKRTPDSSSLEDHTRTDRLEIHRSALDKDGRFLESDRYQDFSGEQSPGHNGLCLLEQQFFLKAIREQTDLSEHHRAAVDSMKIVLAAEESIRTGRTVDLRQN